MNSTAPQQRSVLEFPKQTRSRTDDYIRGFDDGEKWANHRYVWLGFAFGILATVIVALFLLAATGAIR